MIKNRGAALALLAIILLGIYAAWRSFTLTRPNGIAVGHAMPAGGQGLTKLFEWALRDAISVYTLVLALFTGCLFFVSLYEIGLLRRQDKTTRELIGVTDKQTHIMGAQADEMVKQKEIARQQFIADKRPRLRVRNVVVRPASITSFSSSIFFPHQFVSGQCYVSNHGGTDAKVVEAHCEVFWTDAPLPMERPYEGKNGNSAIRATIPAGGSIPLQFQSDRPLGEREPDDILSRGNCQIYVLGWVEYEDLRSVRRRTAFCRKYDPVRRRFFPIDDPDYEHEE